VQLALGQSFLPRVACEHGLDELQSPLALRRDLSSSSSLHFG